MTKIIFLLVGIALIIWGTVDLINDPQVVDKWLMYREYMVITTIAIVLVAVLIYLIRRIIDRILED